MRIGWRGALGILLSVVFLVWTLHGISLGDVWQVLTRSNILVLVVAALMATLAFPIRAWRWRFILYPIDSSIPYSALWRATAIGMMVNNVFPARAGEVARAYVLARERPGVSFAAALGSLVVDRVFDAIVVLLFLLVVISLPGFPQGIVVFDKPVDYWLRLAALIALAALIGISLLAFFPARIVGIWDRVTARLPRISQRGRGILSSFASGLAVLRDPLRFVLVLFWSIVQWIVNGVSFYVGFKAVGIATSVASAFFVQSMLAMGVAAPSAPGFMGVFELVSRASLSVYGVPGAVSVSFALGYHVLSFIPITAIGLWYFARMGMHFRELNESRA